MDSVSLFARIVTPRVSLGNNGNVPVMRTSREVLVSRFRNYITLGPITSAAPVEWTEKVISE